MLIMNIQLEICRLLKTAIWCGIFSEKIDIWLRNCLIFDRAVVHGSLICNAVQDFIFEWESDNW